jgi:glycosyltransferase involved in cell wall biosynthesis
MIARVDPMKDHATFLAAAALAVLTRPDLAFVLVGHGTEDLVVPPSLSGRLWALGERDDIDQILPALDLAVLSSAFGEGFPNVIGEAMASGVPLIGTNVGDVAAILGDVAGKVVPPRDPAALAAGIVDWFSRVPDDRAGAGRAARERVVGLYALPAVVARYEDIYRALAR